MRYIMALSLALAVPLSRVERPNAGTGGGFAGPALRPLRKQRGGTNALDDTPVRWKGILERLSKNKCISG